jgi:hypothetical protein
MLKIIVINLFIPITNFVLIFLEYKKIFPIKYRLFLFHYGIPFLVAQLVIFITTVILWKKRSFRLVAIAIFLVYILVVVLGFLFLPPLYLYD